MPDIGFLLKVSRPRFWLYLFGPYVIGLVAGASNIQDLLSFKNLLFGIYFLFPANLLIYGVNDIFDFETDRLNPKKVEYEALVEPKSHRDLFIAILIFNLPFIIAAAFLSFSSLLVIAGFLFFSIFYSAPPIRAKAIPILDSIFNILYIFPGIFAYQITTGQYPSPNVIAAGLFWTMAMHAYSAIPDIQADRQARVQTIATMLGRVATLVLCLLLFVLSAVLVFDYLGIFSLILGSIYTIMICTSLFADDQGLFKIYKYFPLINAAAGFILFWVIALSKFSLQ